MSVHQDSCGILDKSNINNSSNDELVSLTLRIKSASVRNHDTSIVEVHTNSHESVADVKNSVRLALGDVPENRYLRLICKGRLLAPDTSLVVRDFGLHDGDIVHVVLAAPGVQYVMLYYVSVY